MLYVPIGVPARLFHVMGHSQLTVNIAVMQQECIVNTARVTAHFACRLDRGHAEMVAANNHILTRVIMEI